eukprot:m.72443 g.72443  ORF g.72443 m.72443 type:complete len:908 (-) comp16964_c0_seq1:53-2776(-)
MQSNDTFEMRDRMKAQRPTFVADTAAAMFASADFDLNGVKTVDQLYDTPEKKELMKAGCMSNGKPVDVVLVWKLPTTAATKDVTQRKFFEDGLTKARVRAHLEENLKKMERDSLPAAEREQLQSMIDLQTNVVEFSVLEIEHEKDSTGTVFSKIHAPFKTLCHLAEKAKMVLPLKPTGNEPTKVSSVFALPEWIAKYFVNENDAADEDDFFSGVFKYSNLAKFRNGDPEDWDRLFNPSQRIYLVHGMLCDTRYEELAADNSNVHKLGLDRLIKKGVYTAAFALHDANVYKLEDLPDRQKEDPPHRVRLFEDWARWGNWHRPQPIERIRLYFGEKIGFYFLWLGFYLRWLFLPGFVGLIIFIYGMGTYKDQTDSEEFCALNLTMCAVCSTCDNWQLTQACEAYRFGYVFDNGGTVFFAFFMACWATLFLEYWKRQTATTAYDWDVMSFEENEPQRPQFKGTDIRPHPVTGEIVRYFPESSRIRRFIASGLVILLMLSLVIWSVIAVIIFRVVVRNALYNSSESLQTSSGAITSILAAVLQLVVIMVLNKVYGGLAVTLTNWENYERQTSYDQALTLKVFLFQFINVMSSIFYIAYFKGRFVGRPGDYNAIFGLRQDDCPEYGCMLELTIQMAVIMVGKQAINNVQEIVLPVVTSWMRSRSARKLAKKNGEIVQKKKLDVPWQEQVLLADYPPSGLFGEYLEMVIQFAFVCLFVAAFPLAPWFAMANNVLEIRVDAKKLCRDLRRPFTGRAENIGVWEGILTTISYLAVITNAFVIAVPSSFIPKLVYLDNNHGDISGYAASLYAFSPVTNGSPNEMNCYYKAYRDSNGEYTTMYYEVTMARLAFVIVFEHAVFFIKLLFAYLVPDVPKAISLAIEKERYTARVALEAALYGSEKLEEMDKARRVSAHA